MMYIYISITNVIRCKDIFGVGKYTLNVYLFVIELTRRWYMRNRCMSQPRIISLNCIYIPLIALQLGQGIETVLAAMTDRIYIIKDRTIFIY